MKYLMLFAIFGFLSCSYGKSELLKYYDGEEKIPEKLFLTYKKLVKAFAKQNIKKIEKHCNMQNIKISTERREGLEDIGHDINLYFIKERFDKYIYSGREISENNYLIRTGTTAMWFEKTDEPKWILYKYLDKPIQ